MARFALILTSAPTLILGISGVEDIREYECSPFTVVVYTLRVKIRRTIFSAASNLALSRWLNV